MLYLKPSIGTAHERTTNNYAGRYSHERYTTNHPFVSNRRRIRYSAMITLGSDPELMLFSKDEGKIVSSMRILKGCDKRKPILLGNGIKMYPDNVLLEAAFPPSRSPDAAVEMINT